MYLYSRRWKVGRADDPKPAADPYFFVGISTSLLLCHKLTREVLQPHTPNTVPHCGFMYRRHRCSLNLGTEWTYNCVEIDRAIQCLPHASRKYQTMLGELISKPEISVCTDRSFPMDDFISYRAFRILLYLRSIWSLLLEIWFFKAWCNGRWLVPCVERLEPLACS